MCIVTCKNLFSQQTFTRKDSLQGGYSIERTCFDIQHYDLDITVQPEKKFISGNNSINFNIVKNTTKIQLDLFENMQIDSIIYQNKKLDFTRDNNAVFISFESELLKNSNHEIVFYYSGNPIEAKNAPWDGGFVWKKEANNKDWIGVAVQGIGASLWYPCKDTQSDEPDLGATIKVTVPNGLMNVSNGRFIRSTDLKNGFTSWEWEVKNPINNYNITLNIGDYVHFGENYKGIDLDYYVLRDNFEKAKKQFEEVKLMMDCFQSKFGTYPFANDGYKLIETNYLGMEHQSAVSYGNNFMKGYKGTDLSGTGFGLLFDFIIVHESGHEWFGNSITSKDIADMWIHESFTCYSESVFLECNYSYDIAQKYINGLKKNVLNDRPILGQYGVHNEGSSDMYYKGALMLNTIRHIINNDKKWWELIYNFSVKFRHKIIESTTVIDFFNTETNLNLTPIFKQYLNFTTIPTLEYKLEKNLLFYKWKADVSDFEMPCELKINHKKIQLQPTRKWKSIKLKKHKTNNIELLKTKFYYN